MAKVKSIEIMVIFSVLGCGGITVNPPPGPDTGKDVGVKDVQRDVATSEDPGKDTVIACKGDEDCPPPSDKACAKASCVEGECIIENLPAGTPCSGPEVPCRIYECDGQGACAEKVISDGSICEPSGPKDPCTTYRCLDGECNPAEGCDDGNPCTEDSCVEAQGICQHTPLSGIPCDDEDPCTEDDKCFAGKCLGKAKQCDDENPCTEDRCDPAQGCLFIPLSGIPCEDGDACTLNDSCQSGECKPGALVVCNDGNACTDDSCDSVTGKCLFVPNNALCDDGDICTKNDRCENGMCKGEPLSCDDNDPCTEDYCEPGSGCVHPALPGCKPCQNNDECNDGNPCTDDLCENGKCNNKPASERPCEDGNPCTIEDKCVQGKCTSGPQKDCNDNNVCTQDLCDPSTGACVHKPIDALCDDKNPCTVGDVCKLGQCVGTPITCNDNNPCTDDYCDTKTGQCVFKPNTLKTCDDGQFCTTNDTCVNGYCQGTPVTCDDQNPCTTDRCDEEHDKCVNEPIGGCLNCNSDADCNDNNVCTADKCVSGQCKFTNLSGTVCNDGNACTENDKCDNGTCKGTPITCPSKVCNSVTCDPKDGCVYTPLSNGTPCDDGNPCTGPDYCQAGKCVAGPLLCCEGKPDGTPCSDQDSSTKPDYCINGQCKGFWTVTLSDADETVFTAVDAVDKAYATGWFRQGDSNPTSFVAEVPFGQVPGLIKETLVSDGRIYRSISGYLAVGDGGLVAYRTGWDSKWQLGGVLGKALNGLDPLPGNLTDVFGVIGPAIGGCSQTDSYILVGRDSGDKYGFVRHCMIYQEISPVSCLTSAKCGSYKFLNDTDPKSVYPYVASGAAHKECPDICISEGFLAGRVVSSLGVIQNGFFVGLNNTGLITEWKPLGLLTKPAGQPKDAIRFKDASMGYIYLTVGDGGHLVALTASGELIPLDGVITDGQSNYTFTGVALAEKAGYLLISGVRESPISLVSEAVLILHPLSSSVKDKGSYVPLVLATCKEDAIVDCSTLSLADVAVLGYRVYVVVTAPAGSKTVGTVYFLDLNPAPTPR